MGTPAPADPDPSHDYKTHQTAIKEEAEHVWLPMTSH